MALGSRGAEVDLYGISFEAYREVNWNENLERQVGLGLQDDFSFRSCTRLSGLPEPPDKSGKQKATANNSNNANPKCPAFHETQAHPLIQSLS